MQNIENNINPTVFLGRCADYGPANIAGVLEKHFWLACDDGDFVSAGDKVLIKPNLIAPKTRAKAVQTDPAIIFEVARIVKDLGGKPFIADSPAWSDAQGCIKALGLKDSLRYLGVPVRQMNKPKRLKIGGTKIGISRVALEADRIINLPKFKTHQQLMATFAVKNMYGCVCGKEKALRHYTKGNSEDEFCEMLIEIYKLLAPSLNIIDAVIAMQGGGPINGEPETLGFVITGRDPIACETICARLINLNPDTLPMIKTAKRMNFGCSDMNKINIVGDDYKKFIRTDFKLAKQTPLKFSFTGICKSAAKQLWILIKQKPSRAR